MSAASFWEALKAGALRQPRVCQWPGCKTPRAEDQQDGAKPARKRWKITLRDDSLPHQIRITLMPGGSGLIAVSCNCLRVPVPGTPRYEPIEARSRWEPHEPIEIWREHMAAVGAA